MYSLATSNGVLREENTSKNKEFQTGSEHLIRRFLRRLLVLQTEVTIDWHPERATKSTHRLRAEHYLMILRIHSST